jgi:hypothetical protein
MKFFRGDLKSRYDFYNMGIQKRLFSIEEIREHEDYLSLIDKMIEQVEDLKAIVRTQQILNDRMLEIVNGIGK